MEEGVGIYYGYVCVELHSCLLISFASDLGFRRSHPYGTFRLPARLEDWAEANIMDVSVEIGKLLTQEG